MKFGIEIKKPNETVFNKDILYIIMATKARNDAVKILSEIGAKYIFVDRFSDRWVDNFE